LHATKENSKLKEEVAYLSARLERTKLTEKMIEDDLSRVEESATKFTYKLGVGFERGVDKGEKSCRGNLPRVPWAASYGPNFLDTIGSLQWQTAGEPNTPYQETTPHL
jgi:hypothetical protein